jgi:GNAT superfamily N-acetyltransferase
VNGEAAPPGREAGPPGREAGPPGREARPPGREAKPPGREAASVTLRDLPPGDPAWASALPVLQQLRPHLDPATFDAILRTGAVQGLRYTGAFVGDRCVGLAGWRVMDTTSVVRKLYVDDLVTDAAHRSRGVGVALLAELDARAATLGCTAIELDSGHQRADAHRFYRREGFEDVSRHFRRQVGTAR